MKKDYLSRAGKTILIMVVVVGSITYVHGLNKHAHSPLAGQTSTAQAGSPADSFEDLLDAIEWVESRGDPNAVGDNGKAVGAYQIWKIYVDDVNRIIALYMKDVDFRFTYKDRWDKDESRTIVGIYTNHYSKHYLVDTWQLGMSSNEASARIHNAGPDGWRNDPEWFVRNRDYTLEKAKKKIANAKKYWAKVKARLEK